MNQEAMRRISNLRGARRCGARNRAGTSCQCPAIKGRGRCRLHGGLSPGAPRGKQNGNFRHGFWTCEAVHDRRWAKEMIELYTKGTDE
jgi:hypothetical protein